MVVADSVKSRAGHFGSPATLVYLKVGMARRSDLLRGLHLLSSFFVSTSDGLQPTSDGLQPTSDGLQPM